VFDHLHHLERHPIHLIREAYARLKPLAMLWSLGKDSNTMLWLTRKAFQGRVPFSVILHRQPLRGAIGARSRDRHAACRRIRLHRAVGRLRGPTLRRLSLALAACAILAGCAIRPTTPELDHVVPGGGYRWDPAAVVPGNDPQTLFVLTFSGGGTRAAAFAFGVLEELRRTPIAAASGAHTALDEVDLVTGTSGGSFTALAYALYGTTLFDMYEEAFLKRNVEGALLTRLFNPVTWPKVLTQGFGRSELAEQYYDEILFHGATYADLMRRTPVAIVGATDVTTGNRIDFSQGQFDFICGDLTRFPLSRAAAASSAVPVVLSPVTLDNRGGTCGYRPTPWMTAALKSPQNLELGNRAVIRLKNTYLLQDSRDRPYIHLVDGGLADNLALLSFVEVLQLAMDYPKARALLGLDRLRRVAVIIVNAASTPDFDYDKIPAGPNALAMLAQSVSVPMARYSTASIAALQDVITEWQLRQQLDADARRLGQGDAPGTELPAIEFTVVDVSFDAVTDPELRKYLQNLPTSFALSEEAVDRLRASAAQVLRDSPAFRRFVGQLGQPR
jgi:NTE family protein